MICLFLYNNDIDMSITSGIIKLAIDEAEKSVYRFRVGAVVFKGSRILSSGHNGIRSSRIHPFYKKYNNACHAEQDAILNIKDWSTIKGCSILVVKISKKIGILSNARPCSMCQELLRYTGIKTMFYSNTNGEIISEKLE